MADPRDIAQGIVGAVDWQTEVSGFCRCPGAREREFGRGRDGSTRQFGPCAPLTSSPSSDLIRAKDGYQERGKVQHQDLSP